MSLKRKSKVSEGFSMASMTDVIFLLLIFFLVASTVIIPNTIKVSLPSAQQQPVLDEVLSARISIKPTGELFLGLGREADVSVTLDELDELLNSFSSTNPQGYVAIHADQEVPYRTVMEAVNAAAKSKLRVVLATKVTHR